MVLRKTDLSGQGHTRPMPPIVPLSGLQPFKRGPALEVLRGQDRVVSLGRRIVADTGCRGDIEWRVPDTDPSLLGGGTETHPNATTWYVIARGMGEITPGSFLRLVGACVPSGETQHNETAAENAAGSRSPDGAQGHVRVTVVWTDRAGASETTVRETSLPASTREWGKQDSTAEGLWRTLCDFTIPQIRPPEVPENPTELARFSQHCTAEITIEERGSPRIVDIAVYEEPVSYAYTIDDNVGFETLHVAGSGTPDGPVDHAYAFSAHPDTAIGTGRVLEVAHVQARRLGPRLLRWTGYDHTNAAVASTEYNRTTSNDGTTFEDLLSSAITTFSPTSETGFSVGCGGYARRWAQNNPLVLFDRTAVIPVLVRVYGRTATAGVGTVRVQTSTHSYVDVDIPIAVSNAWVEAFGWLEVSVNPDDLTIAQVRINHLGASGSLNLSALEVYYMDPDAPPEI